MTDPRARRVAALTAAAQAKSAAKTAAAEQAIRRLIKHGQPITFQAVQREAGVSHAFLYNHPDLRGRIEHLRAQRRPPNSDPTPPTTTTATTAESTLVLALTAQINQLKQQHRTQVQALHTALEQAHGENLDLRRELARRGSPGPLTPHPPTDVASSIEESG